MGTKSEVTFDLLRPDVGIKVHAAQSRQKKQHDQRSQMQQVEVGDSVNVRNYSRGPKWIPGTVIQETGPLSARIELEDGTVVRKHHDQVVVCPRPSVTLPSKSSLSVDSGIILPDADLPEGICGDSESRKNTEAAVSGSTTPVRRYPVRNRNPPAAFLLNGPILFP